MFLKIVCYIFISIIAIFIISFLSAYIYWRLIRHKKPIKDERGKWVIHSPIRRILFDFPYRFVHDKLTIDPNTFQEYGLHMICGMQGSGKTMLLNYLIKKYKSIYPRAIVTTNFEHKDEDFPLKHWEQLTLNTNGIYGEIDCIDEIQNWFSSNASKNFPPDMLTIVTQQRKVRRCILATSQVFTRISKPLREATYKLYLPMVLFGCFEIVRVYIPEIDQDGNLVSKKLDKVFFFIHDDDLRNSYDSYKTICSLTSSGFIDTAKAE